MTHSFRPRLADTDAGGEAEQDGNRRLCQRNREGGERDRQEVARARNTLRDSSSPTHVS